MSNENILYRVYDKKGRYQQSYSAKLQDARSWAVDCAILLNGSVKEDLLNESGAVEKTQNIFDSSKK
tara:strand:- start:155 stop:355 length:201 start_codon:yes stop_codon:yes gene_type:complete